ncbi:MAG: ATP-binding protein [Acetobacteraceae bacterium]|nr:ATP-binding protein [Acetobacteraceae bacterium]
MAARRVLGRLIGGEGGTLREAIAALPDALLVVDARGRLVAAGGGAARMLAPEPLPAEGEDALSLFAAEHRAALLAALAAPPREPLRLLLASTDLGPPRWAAVGVTGLPGGGAVLRLSADAAEAEQAAARESERLASLGRLAGGIAHDVNNLLTAVMGGAEAVLARGVGPEQAEDLRTVLAAAQRGADLVRRLLAFARRQQLAPRVVALNDAVAALAPLLRRTLGRSISLRLDLEEPGRCVRVDPSQLDQVVVNLAVNAAQAMPGGGRITISTGHRTVLAPEPAGRTTIPPGRWVTLDVADTGPGIPPEVLPRLFEPFFTTRREQGGTGLGLATVLGILRQSGGEITVESAPGEGARFRVWLPRHPGPPDPVETPPESAAKPHPGARILLVEDEAPLRRLAERALLRAGYVVDSAADAEEASDRLDGPPPGLLVSDVSLPGRDGLALARAARAAWPDLPVLLMSGYAEAALGTDLAAEGIAFLGKPFTPAELLAAVGRALAPPG